MDVSLEARVLGDPAATCHAVQRIGWIVCNRAGGQKQLSRENRKPRGGED
jgi:hypothetical protein